MQDSMQNIKIQNTKYKKKKKDCFIQIQSSQSRNLSERISQITVFQIICPYAQLLN